MPRAVIVHCWGGSANHAWYPQTKREMLDAGIVVAIPEMGDQEAPQLKHWLSRLKLVADPPSSDLFLVGHSLGCITILNYLQTLPAKEKIGGAIFVAGNLSALAFPEIANFFAIPLDWQKIAQKAERFFVLHAEDDPIVPVAHARTLQQKLNAEGLIKKNGGHFSGPLEEEGSCIALPEVAERIFQWVGH